MKIVADREIQRAIKKVKPYRIAVAYVGMDWRRYINAKSLEEIILSPTLGSNPRAISDIVTALGGWDKVHFLTNLHSKIYLGKQLAVIASSNLSSRGLAAEATDLREMGCTAKSSGNLEKISKIIDDYRSAAVLEFPCEASKKKALVRLERSWGRAIAEGLIKNDCQDNNNENMQGVALFDPKTRSAFHICWYRGAAALNHEVIKAMIPEYRQDDVENVLDDYLTFAECDYGKISDGDWILVWKAKVDSKPNIREKPYWMYIHTIVPRGADCEIYPVLAIQRKDKISAPSPFDILPEDIVAFRRTLESGDFPEFLRNDDETWKVSGTFSRFSDFIAAWQDECLR